MGTLGSYIKLIRNGSHINSSLSGSESFTSLSPKYRKQPKQWREKWLIQLSKTDPNKKKKTSQKLLVSRKPLHVYHCQNSIYGFDPRYALLRIISSKRKDQQVPVLLPGMLYPHFYVCKIARDSRRTQNGTWSQFGVGWVFTFGKKKKTSTFLP